MISENTKAWLEGLVAAVIVASSNAVILCVADPATFNISAGGLKRVGTVMFVSGALSGAAYLKQSPLPSKTTTTSVTVTKEVSGSPPAN